VAVPAIAGEITIIEPKTARAKHEATFMWFSPYGFVKKCAVERCEGSNVLAQGRAAGLPAERPSGAAG
jgi:hypothetical protein